MRTFLMNVWMKIWNRIFCEKEWHRKEISKKKREKQNSENEIFVEVSIIVFSTQTVNTFMVLWLNLSRPKPNTTNPGSTSLAIMGGGSCSDGRGFESQYHIHTGWTFSHLFIVMLVCRKNKNKPKETGDVPFFNKSKVNNSLLSW